MTSQGNEGPDDQCVKVASRKKLGFRGSICYVLDMGNKGL
jgi:hypothetical protein